MSHLICIEVKLDIFSFTICMVSNQLVSFRIIFDVSKLCICLILFLFIPYDFDFNCHLSMYQCFVIHQYLIFPANDTLEHLQVRTSQLYSAQTLFMLSFSFPNGKWDQCINSGIQKPKYIMINVVQAHGQQMSFASEVARKYSNA